VLWRVSASFTLPVLARLTDGTYLSELRGKRKKQRVAVRVIEYSIRDDDGTSEVFALITNLLDPDDAPALELARNYSERWHIELLFRLVKVDLRTPGGILRSRSPQGVRQEIWALLCLYQALRTLITRTALIARLDATRISFPPALDGSQRLRRPGFSPLMTWPPPSNSSSPTYPAGSSVTAHTAPPQSQPSAPACATPPAAPPTQEPASSPEPSNSTR
jgi:hypothetical protein